MFVAIHYDSKMTGSKELRLDHSTNVFDRLKGEFLTSIGEYVYAYDSCGTPDPIFDGFLAGMALLSNDAFDTHFMYVPTQYKDIPRPNKHVSGLSTQYTLDPPLNRSELPIDYKTANHIFLLGPMNKTAANYIMTLTGDVIFHIQGDATSLVKKTTSYPDEMTEYIPDSFNFWKGESEMKQIRSKMTHTFTVKCKPQIDCNYVSVIVNDKPNTVFIPTILLDIREYMVQKILLGNDYTLPFSNLYIQAIFQDMIDKDNVVSCSMLLGNSENIPYLSIIGTRVCKSVLRSTLKECKDLHPNEFDQDTRRHSDTVKGFMDLLPFEFTYNSISDNDIVDGMEP